MKQLIPKPKTTASDKNVADAKKGATGPPFFTKSGFYKSPDDTFADKAPKTWGKRASSRGRKSLDATLEKNPKFVAAVALVAEKTDLDPGFLAVNLLRENHRVSLWIGKKPIDSWVAGAESFYGHRKELKKISQEKLKENGQGLNGKASRSVVIDGIDISREKSAYKMIKWKKSRRVELKKTIVDFKTGESAMYAVALLLKRSERKAKLHFGNEWDGLTVLAKFAATRYNYNTGNLKKFSFKNAYDNRLHNAIQDGNRTKSPYAARLAMTVATQAIHVSQKFFSFPSSWHFYDVEYEIHDIHSKTPDR